MNIALKVAKEEFILNYLRENVMVNALDENFHDAYAKQFGVKQKLKMWGAMPCPDAMRVLSRLYSCGILTRGKICMEKSEGWPTWIYCYQMKKAD